MGSGVRPGVREKNSSSLETALLQINRVLAVVEIEKGKNGPLAFSSEQLTEYLHFGQRQPNDKMGGGTLFLPCQDLTDCFLRTISEADM